VIAEARPFNAEPIAGALGPVDSEELPYPSTVTGAVPLGSPRLYPGQRLEWWI
jgi:hypothetical protein